MFWLVRWINMSSSVVLSIFSFWLWAWFNRVDFFHVFKFYGLTFFYKYYTNYLFVYNYCQFDVIIYISVDL